MADPKNMTNLEKCEAGLEYTYADPALGDRKRRAKSFCAKLDAVDPLDSAAREAAARELIPDAGVGLDIQPGFNCDYGLNIHIGDHFTANYNVTILDVAPVHIGDYCMFGPGTMITTVNHPLDGARRRGCMAQATPVTIGDDVWMGGNVCVMPGVTIGNNVVIGAGAVVTKDIPDNSVCVGVPARVIRELDPNVKADDAE